MTVDVKQFPLKLYPNTQIKVGVKDLLSAPTDTIVNPANSGLSHGGGLAATIAIAAGEAMEQDCEKIIQKHGRIPKTFAVPTRAGNLPYKCIIHAVGPRMGDGDEYGKLIKTIFNAMKVCFKMNLKSIAFPAISTGIFAVPKDICAKAFIEALRKFWSEEEHRRINLVWVCLTLNDFPHFEKIMKKEAMSILTDACAVEIRMCRMDLTEERAKEYNKYYDLACEGIMELIVMGKGKYTPLESSQESRVRKAIEYFNKALIIYTGHWPCMFLLAKLHQRLNEHEIALEYFESALLLDSENHNIPLEASISGMHLNKIDTALHYSLEALRRKPDHCEILGNHAYFLLVAGRYEEAREVIQKAVDLYPDDETNELIEVIIDKAIKGEISKPDFRRPIGK